MKQVAHTLAARVMPWRYKAWHLSKERVAPTVPPCHRCVPDAVEVTGIPMPGRVNGIEQDAVHGTSMVPTFADVSAPSTHATQYFEILGNRAIYHDGWMASCFHGRLPWIRFAGFEFDGEQEVWELYHGERFFRVDLAAKHPEKLRQLQDLFEQEAERYGVYPLRDASGRRGGDYAPPHSLGAQQMTTAHTGMTT